MPLNVPPMALAMRFGHGIHAPRDESIDIDLMDFFPAEPFVALLSQVMFSSGFKGFSRGFPQALDNFLIRCTLSPTSGVQ
jgi:hypothetical protein